MAWGLTPDDEAAVVAFLESNMGDSTVQHINLNRQLGRNRIGAQQVQYTREKLDAFGTPEAILDNSLRHHCKRGGKWTLIAYRGGGVSDKKIQFQLVATEEEGAGGNGFASAMRDLSGVINETSRASQAQVQTAISQGNELQAKMVELLMTTSRANLDERSSMDAAGAQLIRREMDAKVDLVRMETELRFKGNDNGDQMKMMMMMMMMQTIMPVATQATNALQLHYLKRAGLLEDMTKQEARALLAPPKKEGMDPMMMMMMMMMMQGQGDEGGGMDPAMMMMMMQQGQPQGAPPPNGQPGPDQMMEAIKAFRAQQAAAAEAAAVKQEEATAAAAKPAAASPRPKKRRKVVMVKTTSEPPTPEAEQP